MAERPSKLVEQYRPQIRDILARYRAANPRIFGSVTAGTDRLASCRRADSLYLGITCKI